MTRVTFVTDTDTDTGPSSGRQEGELAPAGQGRRRTGHAVKIQTMQDQILIISNPPQGEVDLPLAAPCFGLAPAEVRMKANYGVPEIWVADADAGKIDATAQTMRLAGLKVEVMPGSHLLLPAQAKVTAFAFEEHALAVAIDGEMRTVGYDVPLVAVWCQPRRQQGDSTGVRSDGLTDGLVRHRGGVFMTRDSLVGFGGLGRSTSAAGGTEGDASGTPSAFLDLYLREENGVVRMSFLQDGVDFSSLGRGVSERPADGLTALIRECEQRFPRARVDRRLVDMMPRQRPMVGTTTRYDVVRKGYSFATKGLSRLLASIAPGLEDMSQFELASRLAFLTSREHGTAHERAA